MGPGKLSNVMLYAKSIILHKQPIDWPNGKLLLPDAANHGPVHLERRERQERA